MLAGTHVMVDLYGAADPGEDTSRVLADVARLADLKVLEGVEHIFPSGGYGRTTMLVLSESHTSVHTWPENRYVAFDLFSCRDLTKGQVDKVVSYMKKATGAADARVNI
ncbi:MAG: S-adenosylmethionine decarboxylase family protein, partial [Planctomycetota bacterium]